MRPTLLASLLVTFSLPGLTLAADVAAGKAKVDMVCAACHGATGVSVSDAIPNLAGQKTVYLENQLKALKDGSRKAPVMNAIASQLSPEDMANVAAFFAAQPGATGTAKSALLPNLSKTLMNFPEGYPQGYVKYHTINFPATKQVRYYYANPAAVAAAREGREVPNGAYLMVEVHAAKLDADKKPITGPDGFYVADKLMFYTAMARDKGWGQDIPDMLRNDEWNYSVYTVARQHRPGVNQAECLACHKPLDQSSYMFTIKELTAAVKAK